KTKWVNHSWHVALYVTPKGLTTSIIHDEELKRSYALELDLNSHKLVIECTDGATQTLPLQSESVALFYDRCFSALAELGIRIRINDMPNEVENPIPFSIDTTHTEYNRDFAHRFWQTLLQADRLMKIFRAGFVGKVSPVHFFWGSNDMAVTRFS